MKIIILILAAALSCPAAYGQLNVYEYTGNGTDPNDWFDAGNWSGGGGPASWPSTSNDRAWFENSNTYMIISQIIPAHNQMQIGREQTNEVVIATGGTVSPTDTYVGVAASGNNGKGSLVIDGGTLSTERLFISHNAGASSSSNVKVKSGTLELVRSAGVGGSIILGNNEAGRFEMSGGTVDLDFSLQLKEGELRIVGSDGTMTMGDRFQFGANGNTTNNVETRFVLAADGSVSTINANEIIFGGIRVLTVDATFCETSTEQTLVLIELTGSDTFSSAELDDLNSSLQLIGFTDGSLSLSPSSKQLIFTGTPNARELIQAWEFNTLTDTEGWDNTTANSHFVGVDVANDIDGVETVLTCSDVDGIDGQLFYNQTQNPGSAISPTGKIWRTLEIRLRQLDDNPGQAGVDSKLFDRQGTNAVLESPSLVVGEMTNLNLASDLRNQSDDWILVRYDISGFGTNDLQSLRIDPIGNAANTDCNFEIDYIRLYAGVGTTPPQPELVTPFFTPGDPENWFGVNADVTTTNAINGSEGVMTSTDVTSVDPMARYTNTVSPDSGTWDTIEFRARQLTGNPGEIGTTSQAWNSSGTVALIEGVDFGILDDATPGITITPESDGWVLGVVDISSLSGNLDDFRLDFVGNAEAKNFEVDYIRLYKLESLTDYEHWANQKGLTEDNDSPVANPDGDPLNNLGEYAFGGDPTDANSSGITPVGSLVQSGEDQVFEYIYYRNSSPYSVLTYSLQQSDALGVWTGNVAYVEVGSEPYTDGLDAVTVHIPVDAVRKFFRANVE